MPVRLNFEKTGSGKPMILLHGLFGSGRNLKALSRFFSGSHTVYTLDLRNHGKSSHHDIMDYFAMADDVHEFIKEHNIVSPILAGHSMGGKVAMVNALINPHVPSALVVLDIAPVTYTFEYQHILDSLVSLDTASIKSRREADEFLSEYYENPQFRQFLLQNLVRDKEGYAWRLNLASISANIHHITGFPEFIEHRFQGPSLFLGGGNSDYLKDDYRPVIDGLFPNNMVRRLENAGHWLHAEQTESVNAIIGEFLQTHSGI